MHAFDIGTLEARREETGQPWLEFFRAASLSIGVYQLKAGQEDRQRPHTEDEVYYVIKGRATFRAGDQERAVEPGTILFVGRSEAHRFHHITEDLTVLVIFAPPEGSAAAV